jgi:hypothetical protein
MSSIAPLDSIDRAVTRGRTRGIPDVEEIREVVRIERILRGLARVRTRGRIIDDAGETVGSIVAIPRGSRHGSSFRWDYDGPPWPRGSICEIAGPLSLYRFTLDAGTFVDGQIDAPAPQSIARVRTRREVRHQAPPDTVVRFRGPGGRPVVWSAEDVSRGGLAFAPSASFGDIRAGDVIANAVVEWRGRLRVRMDLHVRHVSEHDGSGRRVAGAQIEFASSDDARHWGTEVDGLTESTTRADGSWTHDLWELYERSGYFGLSNKTPAEFEFLREVFEQSSRKLARAPDLGTQIVWPSTRGIESSVSLVALNHHAIFLYHVARRHGNPPVGSTGRTILHDVYSRAIGWIAASPVAKWLVVWVQDAGDFSKKLHLDFVRQQSDHAHAGIERFRALEVSAQLASETRVSTTLRPSLRPGAWTTRAARFEDSVEIGAAIAARLPSCVVEALGLTQPFERRWSAWDDSSLLRGRDIVVAERDGLIGAVAVIECAEDGIHLYGLLDVMRVIPVRDFPGATEALLAHAREMFQQIGKRTFIFACDPDVPHEQWPADAIDLGLTHCTVISTTLLPRFADHAWELTMGSPE